MEKMKKMLKHNTYSQLFICLFIHLFIEKIVKRDFASIHVSNFVAFHFIISMINDNTNNTTLELMIYQTMFLVVRQ